MRTRYIVYNERAIEYTGYATNAVNVGIDRNTHRKENEIHTNGSRCQIAESLLRRHPNMKRYEVASFVALLRRMNGGCHFFVIFFSTR